MLDHFLKFDIAVNENEGMHFVIADSFILQFLAFQTVFLAQNKFFHQQKQNYQQPKKKERKIAFISKGAPVFKQQIY